MIGDIVKNKRIAFVFGDPAGAKAMIAISKLFNSDIEEDLLLCDRSYSFFKEMYSDVCILKDENQLFDKLNSFKPQLIFTGTSLPISLELKCLKFGKKNNIQSAVFIDHYTNLKKRFIDEDNNLLLPDNIYVIDKRAYDLAVKDGLPDSCINIISNPYYEWLSAWVPTKSRNSIYEQLNLQVGINYIVFAPEPLDKFNLREKYGFSEYDVLKDIDEIICNHSIKSIKLIFKPHPNISKEEVESIVNSTFGCIPQYMSIVSDIDFNHLIYYSSAVFGFFSNSMIEASKLGSTTFRILYKLYDFVDDPLNGLEVGMIINSRTKLSKIINQIAVT